MKNCPLGALLTAQTRPPRLASPLQIQNLNLSVGTVDCTMRELIHVYKRQNANLLVFQLGVYSVLIASRLMPLSLSNWLRI